MWKRLIHRNIVPLLGGLLQNPSVDPKNWFLAGASVNIARPHEWGRLRIRYTHLVLRLQLAHLKEFRNFLYSVTSWAIALDGGKHEFLGPL